MGLRPTQGDENGSCSATTVTGSAALPFVISTGGVMVVDPPKGMKNGSCSATTLNGSAALPFVISTGAQRSGEICGVSGPSVGGRSQGDEKRVLFSNYCCWKHRPPLCHLDRSAA